jgi:hypothetical protein
VPRQVLGHDRLELKDQRVGNGFLSHKSNCNPRLHVS